MLADNQVITGFNTDIEYQGVTYHVQTEDKGMKTPLILSLVYNRGTILASKRSPYNDLLAGELDENLLAERLQKQHKLICAAIRAGRIEELKKMTAKAAAEKQTVAEKSPAAKAKRETENKEVEAVEDLSVEIQQNEFEAIPPLVPLSPTPKKESSVSEVLDSSSEPEKIAAAPEQVWEIPVSVLEDSVIYDDVQVVEDEIIPAEAVAVINPALEENPVDDNLHIEMLDNVVFKSGERKALALIVKRGAPGVGLEGAHVMVKIIGSSFRPLIFHAKTDANGTAVVHLQLPHFRAGRAALLVKAMSGGEEVELRRSIQHD